MILKDYEPIIEELDNYRHEYISDVMIYFFFLIKMEELYLNDMIVFDIYKYLDWRTLGNIDTPLASEDVLWKRLYKYIFRNRSNELYPVVDANIKRKYLLYFKYAIDKPLIDAVNNYYIEKVETLLKTGASPVAEFGSSTAVEEALKYENLTIFNLLVPYTDQSMLNKLLIKAARKNSDAIPILLEYGADPNYTDSRFKTVLDIIVANDLHVGHKYEWNDIAKLLLEYGADINKQDNIHGNTSLHDAIEKENIKMVQFLIENGADISIKNKHGDSPLQLAYKNASIIRYDEPFRQSFYIKNIISIINLLTTD
jgi:ankyrin repeat protein